MNLMLPMLHGATALQGVLTSLGDRVGSIGAVVLGTVGVVAAVYLTTRVVIALMKANMKDAVKFGLFAAASALVAAIGFIWFIKLGQTAQNDVNKIVGMGMSNTGLMFGV